MAEPLIHVEECYGGGFLAWSPDAPGLWAEADTPDEARAQLWRDLVRLIEQAQQQVRDSQQGAQHEG